MTRRQENLDFPGAGALRDAGRVAPPDPAAVARALAVVRAAAEAETPVAAAPAARRPLSLGRRVLATSVALAAVAAGVLAYGATDAADAGDRPAHRAEAVGLTTFLENTANVAASRPVADAKYWKVRTKTSSEGAKPTSVADTYFARSMDAVYIVVGGKTHKKPGKFNWGLGPRKLYGWDDLNRLPTDPAKLVALMNSDKEYAGQSAFLGAGTLLGATPARPALRAGLYRALGRLPGVKLVGTVKDSTGRSGTELVFSGKQSTDYLVIDPGTSVLLEARQVSNIGSDRGQVVRTTYLLSAPADTIG
ncbi:hypothetical protein [Streptomyces sp. CAU 1734]|uniref:hypothetical protein n=1 Tax=Streptomyces sp. CAU 1734 TaxID=3140360 RepID=UPI003260A825